MDTFGIGFFERWKYILLTIYEVREKKRNVEMFSSGSWNIIGNLVDWYIISSRDGLSLGNNMVWLAREKVSTTDSILSFHFKSESFTKLYDSPVGSYLNGITSLNIYKSESERLSYMHQGTRDTKLRIWVSSPGPRLMVRLSGSRCLLLTHLPL